MNRFISPNFILRRIKNFSERLDAKIKLKDAKLITAKHLDDWIFENVDDLINPIAKEYKE
tara:strand:+ start:69 stop:248 length:180 start_codon:yes stop_codon:yes gene_type:complete